MATALAGCVIVDDKGRNIQIREKCDKCGTLPNGVHTLAPIPSGSKNVSSCRCKKCGNQFKVIVQN